MAVVSERGAGYMPRIVAFGGGTGMSVLLKGLKNHTNRITAVVTVCDDGGSSGRLRADMDILPPGDIRNCLIALADTEPLMEELLQYRFEESDIEGHSLGNLLLAALARITGDFQSAVQEANRILRVRGRVLPSTLKKVTVVATHSDGSKTSGEVQVGKSEKPIRRVELKPSPVPPNPEVLDAVENADLFVFGPGSLYTSVLPSLLVDEMAEAVSRSSARKVYVCNIMTEPGETQNHRASDHLEAVLRHTSPTLVDYVLVNTAPVPEKARGRLAREGRYPVENDLDRVGASCRVVEDDFLDRERPARHNHEKLAAGIMEILVESLGAQPVGRHEDEV